jgi:fructose-specific phosphotransferase system IIA component
MSLIELISEEMIKVPLMAWDKDGVIQELAELLARQGKATDAQSLVAAVKAREALGSTGLAEGIAVPHGKTSAVKSLCVAIGISPEGIDFEAEDGKLSKIFFLIAAPPNQAGPHIQALAEIAALAHSRFLLDALVKAESALEVVRLLQGD